MAPRRLLGSSNRQSLVALAVGVGVAVLIVLGSWGLAPRQSPTRTSPYWSEVVAVDYPSCGTGVPESYDFHGATFVLQTQYTCSPAGANLAVNGTEPSGLPFSFVIRALQTPYTVYSPDDEVGVSWNDTDEATLLVNATG